MRRSGRKGNRPRSCEATAPTGKRWIDAVPGDFRYVPEGSIHAFRNESGQPASMLILFAPWAPREDYFERVGRAASMSEGDRTAFFPRQDTYWI